MEEIKHLGKETSYEDHYNPKLLNPVPRKENRDAIGYDTSKKMPFEGNDVWHGYEMSWLNVLGIPEVGIIKIVYSADSEFIIESKSLKLYLNSFNMSRFDSTNDVCFYIEQDLTHALGVEVDINIFSLNDTKFKSHNFIFGNNLYNITVNDKQVYNEDRKLLKTRSADDVASSVAVANGNYYQVLYTNLLRSNCKITGQPDWGSVFVAIKVPIIHPEKIGHNAVSGGSQLIDPSSFIDYIISFRKENHFHEEVCETIYHRLYELLINNAFEIQKESRAIMVGCFYTRRGGLDINPIRYSSEQFVQEVDRLHLSGIQLDDHLFEDYMKSTKFNLKLIRQ